MFDPLRGWGWSQDAGGNARLMITADGGDTWLDRSPHSYAYAGQGASFLDADHAWLPTLDAITNAHGLIRTADGGETWSSATPATDTYPDYQFLTADDGTATAADIGAGNAYVRFFETHDGGMTWTQVPVSPPPLAARSEGAIHLCNICGDTISLLLPGTVVIAHGDLAGDPQVAARLTVTTDLGKAWKNLRLPLPPSGFDKTAVGPYVPVFFDSNQGLLWAVVYKFTDPGSYVQHVAALYSTRDGGESWSLGPGFVQDSGQVDLVAMDYVVAQCGRDLCVTRDGAQTWSAIQPNIDFGLRGSQRELVQIDFIDPNNGWAVVRDGDRYELYRSTDGGYTWNLLSK